MLEKIDGQQLQGGTQFELCPGEYKANDFNSDSRSKVNSMKNFKDKQILKVWICRQDDLRKKSVDHQESGYLWR